MPGSASNNLRCLSVLRTIKTNSNESLGVLLGLLIDEIVEDLSRSGTGGRSRSVQKTKPAWAMLRRLGSLDGILQAQSWSAFECRFQAVSRDPLRLSR
jgi:hypothetical protein